MADENESFTRTYRYQVEYQHSYDAAIIYDNVRGRNIRVKNHSSMGLYF